MEQKRTLWIIAAVGVALLVIIGAALILWRPLSKDPVISGVQPSAAQPVSSDTWMNPVVAPEVTPPIDPTAVQGENNVTLVNNEVTTIDLNAVSSSDITAVRTEPMPLTVQEKPVTKPVTTEVSPVVTPKATVTPVATPKAEAKKATVTVTEYWVQTGSFSSREYAENAQDSIGAYKIESEIFTKSVNGKIWYRVRMGPYKTHTEADYWMTVIRSDPVFADAYITEVKTQK